MLVLTTGVVTTLMNLGHAELREWRHRRSVTRRHATYLALQAAVALEAYVEVCSEVVDEIALHQDDEDGSSQTPAVPPLEPLPSDEEGWRDLTPELAARALAFPNQVSSARGLVRFTTKQEAQREWKIGRAAVTPDDLPGETSISDLVERETLKLAKEAWKLASDLRRAYELPAFEPAYDTASWIDETLEDAEHLEAARQETRKVFVGMFGGNPVTFMGKEDFPESGPRTD